MVGAFSARKELAGLTHLSIVVGMEPNPSRDAATAIVARLRDAGYQAYFVGGCVRDLVLGRAPKDFDVATSATPDLVLTAVKKAIEDGKAMQSSEMSKLMPPGMGGASLLSVSALLWPVSFLPRVSA